MGGKGQRESRTKISIAACTDEHVNAYIYLGPCTYYVYSTNFTLEGPCSRTCHKPASLDLYHVHVHSCAHPYR